MNKLFRIALCLLPFVVITAKAVSSEPLLDGCVEQSSAFKNQQLVFNTDLQAGKKQSRVFVIKNISGKDIWLDHPIQHVGATAGWASFLANDRWTSIIVDRPNWLLNCKSGKGKMQGIDCQQAIKVCVLKQPQIQPIALGTYWLAENLSKGSLISEMKRRGISWN